ncbi:ribosomal protein S5 domain 2-type protein [Lactarius sanguifluus]|nr:ribosomal protein S5 domain 2-type protein [Lactarius sanguifluus]
MAVSRADGRGNEDLRPLGIVYEKLARVDGSARFGFGEMEALASVSGPIEVRLAAEQPSRATIEVNVRPLSSLPGTESKALAASLRGLLAPSIILSRNPRTLIQLVIQSLTPSLTDRFSPSLVAASINAASLALLNDGSIPMTGVVCAAAVASHHLASEEATSTLVLDPSEAESHTAATSGCFAYLFTTETGESQESPAIPGARLVWTNWHAKNGTFDEGELSRARALGLVGAETVWRAIKRSIPQMDGLPSLPAVGHLSAEVLEGTAQSEDDIKVSDRESDDAKIEI